MGGRRRVELTGWLTDRDGQLTVALGGLTALYLVWQIAGWGGPDRRTLISDLAFLPVGFSAAVLAWRAARHPKLDERTRRAWLIVAFAMLLYFVGDGLWTWLENTRTEPPFPSVADVFYLGFYPALMAGLMVFPTASRVRAERLKFFLDAGTVLLGAWMLVWYFVLGPTAASSGSDPLTSFVSIAYPVGDLVLLFGVTVVILRGLPEGSRQALSIIAAGLFLFVVADVAFGYLSLNGEYQGGDWPDSLWIIAQFLMVVGAHHQHWSATHSSDVPGDAQPAPKPFSRMPYVAVAVSFGLLLTVARRQAAYPLGGLLLGSIALTALVVWRQIATLRENVRLLDELHELAVTDVLTGLPNRRHLFDAAAREFHRARRYDRPLGIVMFDIDHFKAINDTHGHSVGDEVLRTVARECRHALREVDMLGRYGGDEFVALLPESDADAALAVADRLQTLMRESVIQGRCPVAVTLSVGVADGRGCPNLIELLGRADAALYEAKNAGRDCARAV